MTTILNAYRIVDSEELKWSVRVCNFKALSGVSLHEAEQGVLKASVYKLRKQYRSRCPGPHFAISINADTIAVPIEWDLPIGSEMDGLRLVSSHAIEVKLGNGSPERLVLGLLQEGIKSKFKTQESKTLGPMWQNYDRFCQKPKAASENGPLFCRSFRIQPKALANNIWSMLFSVSTVAVDGRTIEDYYKNGEVADFADQLDLKLKAKKEGKSASVRVLYQPGEAGIAVLDLQDPDAIYSHRLLSKAEQFQSAAKLVKCKPYGGKEVEYHPSKLRLILDSQQTQLDHGETIISPENRLFYLQALRDFSDGMDVLGHSISLESTPLGSDVFKHLQVAPAAIYVRGAHGKCEVIPRPDKREESLRKRAIARTRHMSEFGFVESRHMLPLVACPKFFGNERAARLRDDLLHTLTKQGLRVSMDWRLYDDVDDLQHFCERSAYDTLFVVLPEGWRTPESANDTHEQVKKKISLPSQCIQHDRTLPGKWVKLPQAVFMKSEPKLCRRIKQTYEICVSNLLVKHNCLPFTPAEPSNFNVQIGIDVGGTHNSSAMACLGYGFKDPANGLFFLPDSIPISTRQSEPIPPHDLSNGLLEIFNKLHSELLAAGRQADFESVAFYRDGAFLSRDGLGNEKDGLKELFAELLRRGWISAKATWVAIEVMKEAEGMRLLSLGLEVRNPMFGECLFPFPDKNTALVCTTGAPYVKQGTAAPLKVHASAINGSFNIDDVIQDLIWQCDLSYTKPDISSSLPWVLHVADSGALQLARTYSISGITV